MRGFDDKALILYPYMDSYENRPTNYKSQFRKAHDNLYRYLLSQDITPHVFYTDDLARLFKLPEERYVRTLPMADLFFVSNNCDGMADARQLVTDPTVVQDSELDALINKVVAKNPGSLDMSVEQRFELVTQHNSAVVKQLIPQYKIVIHFMFQHKMQYKVTSKDGDNRIRINIEANTFTPRVYVGGSEENAIDVLNVSYGNRALDLWEVL